jgi:hypothetical protein
MVMNRIGGAMVGQAKDYKMYMCCFFTKHAALRRKGKDWMARNQNNVPEWGGMSIRGQSFYTGTF